MSYPTLAERKRAKVSRMEAALEALAAELTAYAREHGGRYVLFGSAARGELRHDSDVDIMVDFPADAGWNPAEFAEERASAHELKPDIHLLTMSSPRLRERVAAKGRVLG
jgi:predicted nucleotidyltransferase